jgi:hypothetical protein
VWSVLPYAVISLYFGVVFAGYGLRGGDLEDCSTSIPNRAMRGGGACPYFAGPLHDNPWQAAVLRYHIWSGRFTVELIEYALSHTLWSFVLVTVALSWLFLWSVRSLLEIRSAAGLTAVACLFFLIVPFSFHASAGVYSTVIFGSWTVFLGVFAVSIIIRLIRRTPMSKAMVFATVPALLVALCSEQFVVAFTFAGGALAHQVLVRRRADLRPALGLYGGLWGVAVVNILAAPGNRVRESVEIDYWMPQFATMNPMEKVAGGMHHALFLLARPDVSTLMLAGLLASSLLVTARHRDEVSLLPGLGVLGWLVGLVAVSAAGAHLEQHWASTFLAVLAVAVPAFWGGAQVTEPYRSDRRMAVMLLGAGFASSMLLSFSPTVWASATRTLLLEYLGMLGAGFILARSAWRCRLDRSTPTDATNLASTPEDLA